MRSAHQFKEIKISGTKIFVGSTNPAKLEAVFTAFEQWRKNSAVIVTPTRVDSKVNSQPVGLSETKLGAMNRMLACADNMENITDNECAIAVGVENGIVTGEELVTAMPGDYSRDHWYDVGFVAVRIYQQNCHFEYVATAEPLQIPNNPERGMLPPSHPAKFEEKLAKYRAYIMPLINRGVDLYQEFSNNTQSRDSTLKEACLKAFQHLGNIHFLDAVKHQYDTALLFGTFDLFHDLHRKLLDDAASIAKEVVVYVNEDENKFKYDAVTHKAIKNTKNTIIDAPEKRRRNVATYLGLRGVAKIKKGKHVAQLMSAINDNCKAGKTVALVGGADQFENYPQIINICYATNTPIITRSREESDTKLCTTDLKAKLECHVIAARLDLNLNVNSRFFKQRINSKESAIKYLRSLTKPSDNSHANDNKVLGLETAEVWRYENETVVRVQSPYPQSKHILLCLPGRTPCDIGRARKVLSTIHHDLVPVNLKDSVACFIGCYQQEEKNTEDDLVHLKENPDYFSTDAMIFTELLILPRIKNGLTGITLWARSYGTVIAIEIENALRYRLREFGYSPEQIVAAAKEIHVLSISNLAPLERPRLFTTVSVTGYNDKQAQKYIENFQKLVEKYYRSGEPISRTILSPTHEVVMTDVPERFTELSTGRLIKDPKRHYTPNYFSLRKPDVVEQVANNAAPILIHEELDLMLHHRPSPGAKS